MTPTILVITGERSWTRRAAHLAGATAREGLAARGTSLPVTIVRMQPVAHLEYLGAGEQEVLLSYEEFDALAEYMATVESYGVKASVETFEYSDYVGGVLGAAGLWPAAAVFAPAPTSAFAPLAGFRLWALRRALWRRGHCPLYTLGRGDEPLVQLTAAPEPNAAPAAQPIISIRRL